MGAEAGAGRVDRIGIALVALIGALVLFILIARFVPAHWMIAAVFATLVVTAVRRRFWAEGGDDDVADDDVDTRLNDGDDDGEKTSSPARSGVTTAALPHFVIKVCDDTGTEIKANREGATWEPPHSFSRNPRRLLVDREHLEAGDMLTVEEYAERYKINADQDLEFDYVLDRLTTLAITTDHDGHLTVDVVGLEDR